MGQVLAIIKTSGPNVRRNRHSSVLRTGFIDRRNQRRLSQTQKRNNSGGVNAFVDLRLVPPELALNILSNLDATDLCLASCVWNDLCNDDLLWQNLCHRNWPFCSVYKRGLAADQTYRQLYLRLDEARLTFNADAFEGMHYLFKYQLLDENSDDLVAFFHTTSGLNPVQKSRFLQKRPQVLDRLLQLKDFRNNFLPNALRHLFTELPAPFTDAIAFDFISLLVSKFSTRFVECNQAMGLSADEVYMLCFSLIMLSSDLWCPHVKNKMSKREFIRNTRNVARVATDEFLGHLYDNVYIAGHVVLGEVTGPHIRQPDIRDILVA